SPRTRATLSPPAWAAWIETAGASVIAIAIGASPPAWAAWIETTIHRAASRPWLGRRPRGRRGLKPMREVSVPVFVGRRRPRGRRGLKHKKGGKIRVPTPSPPAWAAWIETDAGRGRRTGAGRRRPRGRRGLKPTRTRAPRTRRLVAARVGGVD